MPLIRQLRRSTPAGTEGSVVKLRVYDRAPLVQICTSAKCGRGCLALAVTLLCTFHVSEHRSSIHFKPTLYFYLSLPASVCFTCMALAHRRFTLYTTAVAPLCFLLFGYMPRSIYNIIYPQYHLSKPHLNRRSWQVPWKHCRLQTRPGHQTISAPIAYPPSPPFYYQLRLLDPTWWAYFFHLTGSIPTVLDVSREEEEEEGGRIRILVRLGFWAGVGDGLIICLPNLPCDPERQPWHRVTYTLDRCNHTCPSHCTVRTTQPQDSDVTEEDMCISPTAVQSVDIYERGSLFAV